MNKIINMIKEPTENPKRFRGCIDVPPDQVERYIKKGWIISDGSSRTCNPKKA